MITTKIDPRKRIDLSNAQLLDAYFDQKFVSKFCSMAIEDLHEFRKKYKQALHQSDTNTLRSIVHKMLSTTNFLKLFEFSELLGTYKEINLDDRMAVNQLANEVELCIDELIMQLQNINSKTLESVA